MTNSAPSSVFRVNAPDVTFESFDGEILAINLRNGHYFSLRESAVPIWLMLAGGRSPGEATSALAGAVGSEIAAIAPAVDGLVRQLVDEALLVPVDATEPGPVPSADEPKLPARFVPPVFDRYTDMQQLLLMDPIHEVDVTGWPTRAPETKQG